MREPNCCAICHHPIARGYLVCVDCAQDYHGDWDEADVYDPDVQHDKHNLPYRESSGEYVREEP